MKRFQNILVATEVGLDHHPIVDMVPDLPWLARLTMEDPLHLSQLPKVEKQEKLDSMAKPILLAFPQDPPCFTSITSVAVLADRRRT